jgi:hypothetical protein
MRDRRVIALVVLCALCLAASVAYVARGGAQDDGARSVQPGSAADFRPVNTKDSIVFRNLDRKNVARYGFTAVARVESPAARTIEPLPCDRVYFAAGRGLCLEPAGVVVKQRVYILGNRLQSVGHVTVQGVPSRARVSPDGRYGAVTFFVYGHSYATPGSFSTQTTIIDLAKKKKLVNLERLHVTKDGKTFDSPDFNFWGATFAEDSDRFYATLSSRGTTYLVVGSVRARTARVLREGVECPSLSPDGRQIAFKKRIGKSSRWRLHVLDVSTLRDHPLAETRSVDDQAEWLDDGHVLYGLESSVWVVPADGSGAPRRLLESADSPAVVRSA